MRSVGLLVLLLSLAPATVSGQSVGGPVQTPTSPLPKFVVTLALGDTEAGPSGTFTPEATRALADMKGFLPYKRYTPLDTIYLIGLGGPHQQLRGVDGQHEFLMRGNRLATSAIRIELLKMFAAWPPPPDKKEPFRATLIDTSFWMQTGETVVVGTSRLDGTRALILLVTAVK